MNNINRRLLVAAVFHFVHSVKKTVIKNISSWHKTLSASISCWNKQVSRCCMNFLHELTCQILTNQGIKIGRGAWPTRDYGEKSEKHLSSLLAFLNNWLNFRVRGQFEIKMLIVLGHSNINTTYFIWTLKNKLEPAIIWKLVTCQQIKKMFL